MFLLKSGLILLALILFCDGATVPHKRNDKKFISFDLKVKEPIINADSVPEVIKRDDDDDDLVIQNITLTNRQYFYSIDVAFGSNKQPITLDIDTGSSDTWVVNSNAKCGLYDVTSCKGDGVFRPLQSNTFHSLNIPVYLSYGPGQAIGTYATEDLWLPSGDVVNQLQIVDVTQTYNIGQGLLGIGLKGTEGSEVEYDNLPYALKNQGLINTVGYSLYLNQIDAKSGKIIFGGYDINKVSGNFPDIPLSSQNRLSIPLISLELNGTQYAIGASALLDSGTTYSYLPTDAATSILESLGTYDEKYETYVWSCDQPDDEYLVYTFDGVDIKVPYSALVQIVQDPKTYDIVEGVCQPGVTDGGDQVILGDTFLRSAYVVYNFETRSIKIGQASYSETENIVEL